MNGRIVLTPAESKRLIARGTAELPCVKKAMCDGTVAVAKGTTNAYVLAELIGRPIAKKQYVTGMQLPAQAAADWIPKDRLPDVVFQRGVPACDMAVTDAIKTMGRGDVFIKGANALEYNRKVAGVYIGHNTGGTIGATWGTIVARGIRLVIPISLEKLVCSNINAISRAFCAAAYGDGSGLGMMPITGDIITEIEALELLFAVSAMQTGAGGVGGAEGSVHLLLDGPAENVQRAMAYVQSIQGELPFAQL